MSERPEYITCITSKPGFTGMTISICGRMEGFMFVDLEHAELSVEQGSRLVPCDECMSRFIEEEL